MAEGQKAKRETESREAIPRPPNAEEFESRPEFQRFKDIMRRLLAVPKSELDHKVKQAKKRSPRAGDPNAPGRKTMR
jgi:hypothetical protein